MSDERTTMPSGNDLAAEYALGVLTGADLERARALERSDPQFRAEVARWAGRLAPMLEEVEPAAAPAAVWATIQQRLGATSQQGGNVIALRRRVAMWRGIAAAATALAACLAIVLLAGLPRLQPTPVTVQQPASAPPLVAMVADPQKGMKLVASWDRAGRQLVLTTAGDLGPTPRHSHELWVIPQGGKPRSLGTLPATKQSHVQLSDPVARLLQQGAVIAISLEPPGGSPTGAPTGPVIASGTLTQA